MNIKKKKDREKKVKQKLLRRRTAIQADAKNKKIEEIRKMAEYQLINGKREPVVVREEAIMDREVAKKMQIKERLKKNLEILEGLEMEYDKEQRDREQIQASLNGMTLKEKIAEMSEKAKKLIGEEK